MYKCIKTCNRHYSIREQFLCPKIPVLHKFTLPPKPLATPDLLTISIVLPFQECQVVGIIYYVVFRWASFI